MDSLFGLEFSLPMKFFIAFAIVLILIGTAAYLLRRFGTGALATTTQRNRQPRLAVVDSAPIDGRRKLVLVRRDNIEHLVMIGGPTDVLVEPNIVRAGVQATRETAIRTTSVEPLTLPEEGNWPPIAAAPRPEPVSRPEPVARPEPVVRQEPPAPMRPAVHIPTTQVPPAPPQQPHAPPPHFVPPHAAPHMAPPQQPPVPPTMPKIVAPPPAPPAPVIFHPANDAPPVAPSTEARPVQPAPPPRPAVIQPAPAPVHTPSPAASAEPPSRPQPERVEPVAVAPSTAASGPTAPVRAEAPAASTPIVPAPEHAANEEQNLADMAHRLEAALRRPAPPAAPAPAASAPPPGPAPALRPRPTAVAPPPPLPSSRQQAPSYENLQREMANLLGRQSGSS